MTDRPILFSAPMVQALLAGRKTQTRRVLKNMPTAPEHDSIVHEPKHDAPYFDAYCGGKKTAINPRGMTDRWCWWTRDDRCGHGCKVPYVPGDRLWVKETWTHTGTGVWQTSDVHHARDGRVAYRATEDIPGAGWFPSIFMFRKFSRLTLLITHVRVERLQDCSEVDAIAEGVECHKGSDGALAEYEMLWDAINGPGSWEANPWVVAISFEVQQCNIDQVSVAA